MDRGILSNSDQAAKTVAAMIPGGIWRNVPGQGRDLSPDALAPVFRELLLPGTPPSSAG